MQANRAPAGRGAKFMQRMQGWRPGIAWQLGVGFVGVAVLAAVANFAVQRTISVTTTRVAPPVQAEPRTQSMLRVAQVATTRPEPVLMQDGLASLPALERLSDAVLAARAVPAAERHERLRAGAAEVRATLSRLHGNAGRMAEVVRQCRQATAWVRAGAAGLNFSQATSRQRLRVSPCHAARSARHQRDRQETRRAK